MVLTPPEYTKLPTRTLTGVGDVSSIEGTRVDVNAIANLPIKLAYIELLRESESGAFTVIGKAVTMEANGNTAKGSFVCLMNAKRDRQLFTHYRINFLSNDEDRNCINVDRGDASRR